MKLLIICTVSMYLFINLWSISMKLVLVIVNLVVGGGVAAFVLVQYD